LPRANHEALSWPISIEDDPRPVRLEKRHRTPKARTIMPTTNATNAHVTAIITDVNLSFISHRYVVMRLRADRRRWSL
jgi:hypothetical protein